jgi:hypothetical protein
LECGESRTWALHSDCQNNAIMNRVREKKLTHLKR